MKLGPPYRVIMSEGEFQAYLATRRSPGAFVEVEGTPQGQPGMIWAAAGLAAGFALGVAVAVWV